MAQKTSSSRALLTTAYANNDQAIIVWKYEKAITNCIGFAIFRKHQGQSDAAAEAIPNKVGFADEQYQPSEQRPSTIWPIQRFTWVDFTVKMNDVVLYKVVPILLEHGRLVKDEANASDWIGPVSIVTGTQLQAYFNRGLISSPFFSHLKQHFANKLKETAVKAITGGSSNRRDFLGGHLSRKLFSLLDKMAANNRLSVYGALYELQQDDLIEKLKKIGNRAHIVLGNGSFKT